MYDSAFEACCRTYTKVLDSIANEYGVPIPERRGRNLIDCVMQQVATVVREQCRLAAEEAADEAFRLAAAHMPGGPDEVLFVPRSEIRIAAGAVGRVQLKSVRAFRPRSRRTA